MGGPTAGHSAKKTKIQLHTLEEKCCLKPNESHQKTCFCLNSGEVGVTPKLGKGENHDMQKPCYIEATCRLPYEALVEAINACLP